MPARESEPRVFPSVFVTGLFQLFTGLLLFLALIYRQFALVYLALLLLAMFAGSRMWSHLGLRRLNCRVKVDQPRVFPGETILLQARLENEKFLPVWLKMEFPVPGMLTGSTDHFVTANTGLLWYQAADLRFELLARKRGCYPLGSLRVQAGDFLGFFQKEKRFPQEIEVLVFPRLIPLKPPALPRQDFFGEPGALHPIEDPLYPVATRDYRYGRPARHIHWKASAKQNRLQEKFFEASAKHQVVLLLDVAPFAQEDEERGGEKFEQTLELAASLAVHFHELGYPVSLLTNGKMSGWGRENYSAGKGFQSLSVILELLARLEKQPLLSLEELLQQEPALQRGATCLYLSSTPNPPTGAVRDLLLASPAAAAYVVYAPLDSSGARELVVYPLAVFQGEEAAGHG